MFDIDKLMTDESLEVEGVWVNLGDGAEMLIARENNEEYTDFLQGLVAANRALIDQNDKASRKVQQDLINQTYARHVLKGVKNFRFRGVVYNSGENFDSKVALEMLKVKDFFKKVQGYAQQFDLYRKKGEEEAVGN